MKYYILFGPPGAGKGTQASAIAAKYNLKHISTGELLRAEIAAGTELGRMAQSIIEAGNLVPDYIVEGMIEHVFHTTTDVAGFLLDGFPRTIPQAEALEVMLQERGTAVSTVVGLEVPEEELIRRIILRGQQTGRSDDNMETVKNRLEVYNNQTSPLKAFYQEKGLYQVIPGTGSIDEIFDRIKQAVDAVK